jgi:hypothetical protein
MDAAPFTIWRDFFNTLARLTLDEAITHSSDQVCALDSKLDARVSAACAATLKLNTYLDTAYPTRQRMPAPYVDLNTTANSPIARQCSALRKTDNLLEFHFRSFYDTRATLSAYLRSRRQDLNFQRPLLAPEPDFGI